MKVSLNRILILMMFVSLIVQAKNPLWSILICTQKDNKNSFAPLYQKLQSQIAQLGLSEDIEIVYFIDVNQYPIGFKRNLLIAESFGSYVCFIDESDDVHDKYVQVIYSKLNKFPDCVKLIGKHNGNLVVSSKKNEKEDIINSVHQKPLNHLNPIKRSIAIKFKFDEDDKTGYEWAKKIVKSSLLKSEEDIVEALYLFK